MAWINIPIDKGWMPDFAPFDIPEGGLKEARNILPLDKNYRFLDYSFQETTAQISSFITGVYYDYRNNRFFIGTQNGIYLLQNNNVKELGGGTGGGLKYGMISFCQYGDWIISTRGNETFVLRGYTDELSTPSAPVVTPYGTTGSTSWGYKITACNLYGETIASQETVITNGNATLSSSNHNRISCPRMSEAVCFKVYRTTAGGTPSQTGLIGQTSGWGDEDYLYVYDIGITLSTESPPTTNSSRSKFKILGYLDNPHTIPAVERIGGTGSTKWGYKIVACSDYGQTLPSSEGIVFNWQSYNIDGYSTLDTSSYNKISWKQVMGAKKYKVYRTYAGGTPSTTGLIAETTALTINDTGLSASESVPTQNTTTSGVYGALFCAIYKGFLVLAHFYPSESKKVMWSALEDIENFNPSLLTGSDSQVLSDADGDITGMAILGDNLAITHDYSLTVMSYSGAPYTFSFRTNIIKGIGCRVPTSLISSGKAIYFWGDKDIYAFDEVSLIPVGFGIRDTLFEKYTFNDRNLRKAFSAYDYENGIIYWMYATDENAGWSPSDWVNKILCFNIKRNIFTYLQIASFQIPVMFIKNNQWALGYFNTLGQLFSFTDSSFRYASEIETREYCQENNILMVRKIESLFKNRTSNIEDTCQIKIGKRMSDRNSVTYSSEAMLKDSGYADVRETGRFLRVNLFKDLNATGGEGFEELIGIKVDVIPVGKKE
ncbi:MAG: hypothetical protein AB1567_08570 [bacterium]